MVCPANASTLADLKQEVVEIKASISNHLAKVNKIVDGLSKGDVELLQSQLSPSLETEGEVYTSDVLVEVLDSMVWNEMYLQFLIKDTDSNFKNKK